MPDTRASSYKMEEKQRDVKNEKKTSEDTLELILKQLNCISSEIEQMRSRERALISEVDKLRTAIQPTQNAGSSEPLAESCGKDEAPNGFKEDTIPVGLEKFIPISSAHKLYSQEFESERVTRIGDLKFPAAKMTWKRLVQDFPVEPHLLRRLVGTAFGGAAKKVYEEVAAQNLSATAEKLWEILGAKLYNPSQQRGQRAAFYSDRWRERSETVEEYGARLATAAMSLPEDIPDEALIHRFIEGLPHRLRVQALLVSGDYDDVVARTTLVAREYPRQQSSSELIRTFQEPRSATGKQAGDGKICYRCRRSGHVARSCPAQDDVRTSENWRREAQDGRQNMPYSSRSGSENCATCYEPNEGADFVSLDLCEDVDSDDEPPPEREEGPFPEAETVYFGIDMSHGSEQAVMDTAAKSVWVDCKWYKEHGGEVRTPTSSSASARGADGNILKVVGHGILPPFEIWGAKFESVPVRVMETLPSNILFGVVFWKTYNLSLDLSRQTATIQLDGRMYSGPVWLSNGAISARSVVADVEEEDSIEESLCSMAFDEFSVQTHDREALRTLLLSFRDIFKGFGRANGVEHRILLKPDAVPVCCPVRRRSPAQEDAERKEVLQLVENDIMEPSISPWAAANVFVPKKNGDLRTTTDFRGLNSQTIPDSYPMEDVRGTLDWLSGKTIFSTFDLKDGFFQVPLAEESRPLTAVRTVVGLMQYKRLPQGLKNSPATFQRIVNSVLGDMKGRDVSGFVDDISVGTATCREHLESLHNVLQRFRHSGLKLKLAKCHFGLRSVEILGHRVSSDGILPSAGHVEAIKNLKEPQNAKELLRFLGLANYFSDFIPDFTHRARPLYEMLGGYKMKKKRYKSASVIIPDFSQRWDKQQREAWRNIKEVLSSPTVLISPDRYAEKKLLTDASGYGVGAVLLQKEQNSEKWRPISYGSRKLKGAEVRYTVTEQECLAIVFSLRKWRHYLHGGPQFEIVTDHLALRWLMSLREPRGRLARWMVEIQEFDYVVSHVPGESHIVPDCLSRDSFHTSERNEMRDSGDLTAEIRELSPLPSVADFLTAQCTEFGNLDEYCKTNNGYLRDEEGLLCHQGLQNTTVVVPDLLKSQVLSYFHGSPTNGHYGVSKTLRKLRTRFWWPEVIKDVRAKVKGCLVCELARAKTPPRQGAMVVYHPSRRFEIVAVDVLEISPKSARGNSKIAVIGDTFTRFVWAYPIADEKVETIARVLLDGWFLRYGPPEKLLSDRGKTFAGAVIKRMCELTGVKKIFTSSYHPQCDGFIERMNRTLCNDLAAYVSCEMDWDLHVALACFRYNTSVHEATKITPFKAMFGIEAFDFDAEIGWRTFLDEQDEEEPLQDRLQRLHDVIYQRGLRSRRDASRQYNKALKETHFDIGDRVLLYHPPAEMEVGRKLRSAWLGPYRVIEKLSPVGFVLKSETSSEVARTHINRLRRFSEQYTEVEAPQAGIFPDSRRLMLRITEAKEHNGIRLFRLQSAGRKGFVWKTEAELPEIVVKAFDLAMEDRQRMSEDGC